MDSRYTECHRTGLLQMVMMANFIFAFYHDLEENDTARDRVISLPSSPLPQPRGSLCLQCGGRFLGLMGRGRSPLLVGRAKMLPGPDSPGAMAHSFPVSGSQGSWCADLPALGPEGLRT